MKPFFSIVQPRTPAAESDWQLDNRWICPPEIKALGYPISAWIHPSAGLFVLSAVEATLEPGGAELVPYYHLSISAHGVRCSSALALFALASFDLSDAIEDNHVPHGRVRNFWRPVADRLSGMQCKCIESEPAIKEDKGDFIWRGHR